MNYGFVTGNVKIRSIDIGACRAEVRINGQCLIELAGDVQPYVLRQTAIVGIEVAVVPLIAAIELAVAVSPAVIAAHGKHVLALPDIRRQVEAEGHYPIVREAEVMPVEPDIGTLTCTLKLHEDLTANVGLSE